MMEAKACGKCGGTDFPMVKVCKCVAMHRECIVGRTCDVCHQEFTLPAESSLKIGRHIWVHILTEDPRVLPALTHVLIFCLANIIAFADVTHAGDALPTWMSPCPTTTYYVYGSMLSGVCGAVGLLVLYCRGHFSPNGFFFHSGGQTQPPPQSLVVSSMEKAGEWRFAHSLSRRLAIQRLILLLFVLGGLLFLRLAFLLFIVHHMIMGFVWKELTALWESRESMAYQAVASV